jgi:peptide/nickel transport system permease protein
MAMVNFLARQLGFMLLTLFVVSLTVFVLNEATPGSAARKVLGEFATPEQVDLLTRKLGLDRPLLVRYGEWIGNALKGDFGESLRYREPVLRVLGSHLVNTSTLAAISFALIVPFSMILGIAAGIRESSARDRAISIFSAIVASIPEFALAVFLAFPFVYLLGLLPATAPLTDGGGWSVAQQLVLPVLVIVLFDSGYVILMVRASTADVMQQPYIRTAILKGLPFSKVVRRHVIRNAMITPITILLLQINYLITGLVVVEAVFAYPGFGRMMLEAALNKDIALLQAGALVAVLVAVITQMLGDLVYRLLDPRIRVA